MTEDQVPTSFVYIVTKGQYADYRIVAVYSTQEAAQACLARFPGGYAIARIEMYCLDMPLPDMEMPVWHIRMGYEGEVRYVKQVPRDDIDEAFLTECGTIVKTRYGQVIVECYARDEQHAITIANEQRIKFRMQGKG